MLKKIILMGLGSMAALVLAGFIVPLFFNSNNFKGQVTHQLQHATGYNIGIGGNISIRLLPLARLRVENVSVSSPSTPAVPFARVRVLDVGVKLFPLLNGTIEITRLALNDPMLTLTKNGQSNNWQPARADRDKTGGASPNIVLGGVEIKNGGLDYHDTKADMRLKLSALNAEAGMKSLATPFALEANAIWNDKPVALEAEVGALGLLNTKKQVPLAVEFTSDALNFSADGAIASQQFKGNVAFESDSLLAAIAWLSGQKAGDKAKIALRIKGDGTCSRASCGLSGSTITLNDTVLTGSLMLDMDNVKPEISADLSTKSLDITPYITAKQASLGIISAAFAGNPRWSNTPIDLSILNSVDGNVSIKADRFVARKFEMGASQLRARIAGGTLSADIPNAALYKGTGKLSLTLGAGGKAESTIDLSGVQLQPLLSSLDMSDRFSGATTMQLSLTSQGKSEQALVSNLGGSGNMRITNGTIQGIDIANMLRNVKTSFTGANSSEKTVFSDASATFTAKNGIITNNDLAMQSADFSVGGKGTVDLPNYRLDYRLTPGLGKEKTNLGVAVRVSGPLDNPSYAPDVAGLVEDAIKNPAKLKENAGQIKDAVKDLLKNQKSLFKGL